MINLMANVAGLDAGNAITLVSAAILFAIQWGMFKAKIANVQEDVKSLKEQKADLTAQRVAEHDKRLAAVEVEQSQLRTTIYDMKAKVEGTSAKVDLIYDMLKEKGV